jgi:hypothetical protein
MTLKHTKSLFFSQKTCGDVQVTKVLFGIVLTAYDTVEINVKPLYAEELNHSSRPLIKPMIQWVLQCGYHDIICVGRRI